VGHALRGAGLGGASTHFILTFKKRVFQQKFRPKYAYFLEKKGCKITAAPGGSASEPPLASGGWGLRLQTPALLLPFTDIDLSKYVFSVKHFFIITNSKYYAFVPLFHFIKLKNH